MLPILALAGCTAFVPAESQRVAEPTVALINRSAGAENVRNSAFCGGILVMDGANVHGVVTAAHCVIDSPPPDVLAGIVDLCGAVDAEHRFETTEIRLGSGRFRELAYLPLGGTIPVETFEPSETVSPSEYVAFGWGAEVQGGKRPCAEKAMPLEAASNSQCAADIDAAALEDIEREVLCLRPAPPGTNTCQGDSGGGVYEVHEAKLRLAGMTLGGSGCGAEDAGLYLSSDLIAEFVLAAAG